MKFGIHNPSWVFGPDPAEAFEAVKAKAQWAENHGFVWSATRILFNHQDFVHRCREAELITSKSS